MIECVLYRQNVFSIAWTVIPNKALSLSLSLSLRLIYPLSLWGIAWISATSLFLGPMIECVLYRQNVFSIAWISVTSLFLGPKFYLNYRHLSLFLFIYYFYLLIGLPLTAGFHVRDYKHIRTHFFFSLSLSLSQTNKHNGTHRHPRTRAGTHERTHACIRS